jgi:uncharacterized protein (DUF2147 family)
MPLMRPHRLLMSCALLSLPAAAAPALAGLWTFEEDGTVIEFASCGDAVCATVRRPPPKSEQPAEDPKCGQVLVGGMKPDGSAGQHRGWVLDPASQKRYTARLEPDTGALKLVVSAFGGVYSETYRLRPAAGVVEACKT